MAHEPVTPFSVEPLPATFGAVVRGVRLADLDDSTFAKLYDAWLEYALLLFPDQHLTQAEQVAFAEPLRPARVRARPDQQRPARRNAPRRSRRTTTSCGS